MSHHTQIVSNYVTKSYYRVMRIDKTRFTARYLRVTMHLLPKFPRQVPAGLSPHLPDNYGIRKPLYETSTPF